jgi:hypothetical protein
MPDGVPRAWVGGAGPEPLGGRLPFGDQGIAAARADGGAYQLGEALSLASSVIGLSVNDSRALDLADEAVAIARALGNSNLLALALQSAGTVWTRVDPAKAIEMLEQSFVLSGNALQRGLGHTWKAIAHVILRQYSAAARELCNVLPLLQELGEPYQESIALAWPRQCCHAPTPTSHSGSSPSLTGSARTAASSVPPATSRSKPISAAGSKNASTPQTSPPSGLEAVA